MDKTTDNTMVIRRKAERYCSEAERCREEVMQKLRAWQAEESDREAILSYLYEQGYLNDERYCRAFVHDKVRFAQWGRVKIRYALRAKQLPEDAIEKAINEIDTEEYRHNLQLLAATYSADNKGDNKNRRIRFLMQRGFTYEEIREM